MTARKPSNFEPLQQAPAASRLDLLARLAADPTSAATMTYDEFMAWADEDTLAEWVNGKVVMIGRTLSNLRQLETLSNDSTRNQ